MAVCLETAAFLRPVITSTAEECCAIEFYDPLRNRAEEAMDFALLLPAGHCNPP
jgi:hypothetical protein